MEFNEEANNTVSRRRQILYSIVSGYPSGISDTELKNEYSKIRKLQPEADSAVANMSSALYDVKGTLIDFQTVNGIRIFSVLRKKVPLSSVNKTIDKVGFNTPVYKARLISAIDCNSFCVYLLSEEHERLNFTYSLHEKCQSGYYKLLTVESWMVNLGDCYVIYCNKNCCFLRVKVVKVFKEKNDVMCFLVDFGTYNKYAIKDLRICPSICTFKHCNLRTSKTFNDPAFAIRCCIDINQKLYYGFPSSRTGLQLALGGKNGFNKSILNIQFLSYDQDSEAFLVNVFAEDGATMKLEEAIKNNPSLLEKDLFYSMSIDGDFDSNLFERMDEKMNDPTQHFEYFLNSCERVFADNLKLK